MQLFYVPALSKDGFTLTEEESKHCIRVLRKQKGDHLTLIDGKGQEAIGRIENDNPKNCSGSILSRQFHVNKRNYFLHIAIAPTKNFDRMEWMLEKCIEIGIDEISFIETKNSERNKVNLDRCEKIAISAMKQSKQFFLPQINGIQPVHNFLQNHDSESSKYIAWCESDTKDYLAKKISGPMPKKSILLIGPEGDFTREEIAFSQQSGFIPVSLGSNILRSETAAVFGSAVFANLAQMQQ